MAPELPPLTLTGEQRSNLGEALKNIHKALSEATNYVGSAIDGQPDLVTLESLADEIAGAYEACRRACDAAGIKVTISSTPTVTNTTTRHIA